MGEKHAIRTAEDACVWVPFVLGACAGASWLREHVDAARLKRFEWALDALWKLRDPIFAMMELAREHPGRYQELLAQKGEPVEMETMPQ